MALTKLVGSGNTGAFISSTQQMSNGLGFRNVSSTWLSKCLTYEQGLENLAGGRAENEDFTATIERFSPKFDGCKMVIEDRETGVSYSPNGHSLSQISRWAEIGLYLPLKLSASTDKEDQRVLTEIISNGLRKIDKDKNFFWRTRKDGTLRAMLSDRYMEVNNQWFLESLQKIVPGGLLSHWRGDEDSIYGNVLIPDTIREESDSEYGGMLSVGNSETGTRKISSLPSVFRAICQNGCIWDKTQGVSLQMRHNGQPDYAKLYFELNENIKAQIPLLPVGIGKMMSTKTKRWDGGSINPLLAQIAADFKVCRSPMSKVVDAYTEEVAASSDSKNTLFGVLNAFTRAGQTLDNETWHSFDLLAGRLMNISNDDWYSVSLRAKAIKHDAVDKALGLAL